MPYVFTEQGVAAGKPAPDIFLLAGEKTSVSPGKCIVIENLTNGIMAAKATGMFCATFAGPGSESQDHNKVCLIISSFDKLVFYCNISE